jgi:hypothetical protein
MNSESEEQLTIHDEIDQIVNAEQEYVISTKDVISFVFEEMGISMDDIKPHIKNYIDAMKLKGDSCEHSRVISNRPDDVMCVICDMTWKCKDCFNKINYGDFAWSHHYCCNYNCKHVENKHDTCYSCKKTYNYYQVNEY